jgi:hypothetical protein
MKHHERFYKRLRRDCNIATRPTGISIGALKNATTTTTSRPNATHPPPVTFWVARFIPVDCGQQIQIFGYTVPATGRLEEHVFATPCKAKTASRLWIVWLRSIFLSYTISFFFFSRSIFSQLWVTLR